MTAVTCDRDQNVYNRPACRNTCMTATQPSVTATIADRFQYTLFSTVCLCLYVTAVCDDRAQKCLRQTSIHKLM